MIFPFSEAEKVNNEWKKGNITFTQMEAALLSIGWKISKIYKKNGILNIEVEQLNVTN